LTELKGLKMNISAKLYLVIIICTLFTPCAKAEDVNNLDVEQNSDVSIAITKFDVNDTNLELSWKITNNTDHDIWICDSLSSISSGTLYEQFLDKDAKTLLLRRRFDLPIEEGIRWEFPFHRARYGRLCSGQEKDESVSIALPVQPYTLFEGLHANAEYASRLVLQIGFYDEDLPGLILQIVDAAEKLNCSFEVSIRDFKEICKRFFGGWSIARIFNDLNFTYFRDSVTSGGDEIIFPYMGQVLNCEQVLQIEIDDVSIPYKSNYPPLANQDVNEPNDLQDSDVSIALTHFEVTDANLELGWKITNNTDHDVWICDTINADNPSYKQFEVYMPEDEQTLMIRRRLDVPTVFVWAVHPRGRYVLLRSGQEINESLSLDVPVQHKYGFAYEQATFDHARRLVLEIGFYNEDLPGLIRSIIEVVEKLNCASLEPQEYMTPLFMHYFKGIWIVHMFFGGGLSNFEEWLSQQGNEEIRIPYTWQNLGSEEVLRIEVDGVHIPYEGL